MKKAPATAVADLEKDIPLLRNMATQNTSLFQSPLASKQEKMVNRKKKTATPSTYRPIH